MYPEAGCPYSRLTTRSGLPPHLLCTCPRSDGLRPSDFLLDGHVGCSSLQAKYCPFSTGWMARRYSITLSSIVPSRAPIIATVGSSVIIHQLVSIARKIISCRSEVCRNVYTCCSPDIRFLSTMRGLTVCSARPPGRPSRVRATCTLTVMTEEEIISSAEVSLASGYDVSLVKTPTLALRNARFATKKISMSK